MNKKRPNWYKGKIAKLNLQISSLKKQIKDSNKTIVDILDCPSNYLCVGGLTAQGRLTRYVATDQDALIGRAIWQGATSSLTDPVEGTKKSFLERLHRVDEEGNPYTITIDGKTMEELNVRIGKTGEHGDPNKISEK